MDFCLFPTMQSFVHTHTKCQPSRPEVTTITKNLKFIEPSSLHIPLYFFFFPICCSKSELLRYTSWFRICSIQIEGMKRMKKLRKKGPSIFLITHLILFSMREFSIFIPFGLIICHCIYAIITASSNIPLFDFIVSHSTYLYLYFASRSA